MIQINSLIYAQILLYLLIINILIPTIRQLDIQNTCLFEKYYSTNRYQSIITDFIMNYLLLNIANKLPDKIPIIYRRIITILLFDVMFIFYVINTPLQTNNILFFKELALSSGWFRIIWDIAYINSVGYLTDQITNNIIYNPSETHLLITTIIFFTILHL